MRLYDLIWRQFVACQMTRAEYLSTTVLIEAGEFELKVRGRIMQFDGYTRVLPPTSRKDDDTSLPDLQVGETLSLPIWKVSSTSPSRRRGSVKPAWFESWRNWASADLQPMPPSFRRFRTGATLR